MIININDIVKVNLTPIGQARWRGKFGITRTTLQLPLWELMNTFGSGMYMGMTDMYFVDNEIELVP